MSGTRYAPASVFGRTRQLHPACYLLRFLGTRTSVTFACCLLTLDTRTSGTFACYPPLTLGTHTPGTFACYLLTLGTSTSGAFTLGTRISGTITLSSCTFGTFTLGTRTSGAFTLGNRTSGTFTIGTRKSGTFTLGTRTSGTITLSSCTFGTFECYLLCLPSVPAHPVYPRDILLPSALAHLVVVKNAVHAVFPIFSLQYRGFCSRAVDLPSCQVPP